MVTNTYRKVSARASDIKFKYSEDGFKHNLVEDFACFALWKNARSYRERISNLLSSQFEILLETEIVWSEKHFHDNAARIYETPIYKDIPLKKRKSGHAKKIGDNKFILFVVKDNKPNYTFAKSVSGKIELSNLNIVESKYEFRDWIQKASGEKYGVHSTNNIFEFFFQGPLLLGVDLFEKLLKGEKLNVPKVSKDLEGAEGWSNYEEVFKILNLTNSYLVQRSFESLPHANEEKDIDLLTDNYQRLASTLGVRQSKKHPFKGKVLIDNEEVSLDIRFVGDKYYDAAWQKDMLNNKVIRNGVFIPNKEDYFFSLLFHCRVQKGFVKEKYIDILGDIAGKLNFAWYDTSLLFDSKKVGQILKGYFQSQGYYYEDPIDNGVFKNTEVIKYLPTPNPNTAFSKKSIKRIKSLIIHFLPPIVILYLKKVIKR
jgi:hypothetical protein